MPVYQYEVADRRGSLSRCTAEDSGTLPTMLARPATYYEQQVDQAVATLSSFIEPVMIVVMGAIAGAVIFACTCPSSASGRR